MTEVIIRNKELLQKLDSFVEEFYNIDGYYDETHRTLSSDRALEDPEYFCGEEYLNKQIGIGREHSGYPEEYMSHTVAAMIHHHPEKFTAWRTRVKQDFAAELGAMHSALLNYYPPRGFVGWHTNWNANAYQVLFTWSLTGDGYFKYRDGTTGEIITIQDKPGWQCRHYYFGHKDEAEEHHCWHAAYAGCDRLTLAYKFENDRLDSPIDASVRALRDALIDDIQQEY